jgi:DNA ligase (NAD+)
MMNTQIEKIKKLVRELNEASAMYYNDKQSNMEDQEWDIKFDELKKLEEITGVSMTNSPTINVGYEVKTKLEKVTHSIPLKSLGKTKDIAEIERFIGSKEVLQMLKGDGLTCELIYKGGELFQGSTRGNGTIGEVITHNVKVFKNVPLKINFKGHLKLTGEAIILDSDFILINSKLQEEDKYSNSRNLVAGSVRQLNSQICSDRNVNFMAFALLECDDKTFETMEDQFSFLDSLGFHIIPYFKIDLDFGSLQEHIDILKRQSKEEGIPIDGEVFAYNLLSYANSLKETVHHPLSKIALKFSDDVYETKYIRTEWQVSRTSLINPVGIFQPVDMDGASIERATLHNLDYMMDLQLGKNDIVQVIRANQVIPKIIGNLTKSNTEIIPQYCPICKEPTEIKLLKTAKVLCCTNDNCPSKKISQIEHYCSRNAMNVVGLSEATIEKLIEKGFINDVSDIYKLEEHKKELIKMEGFGTKSYNNLVDSINTSKNCELTNFIYGIGISNVGIGTSECLAKRFKTIDNIRNCNLNELLTIEDIGEITSQSIANYFDNSNNQELLNKLLEYVSFNVEKEVVVGEEGVFNGLSLYCTGTFSCGNKDTLKKMVEDNGGIYAKGYAKSLGYLVIGSLKGSSKSEKALKDGVEILSEEMFLKMIK